MIHASHVFPDWTVTPHNYGYWRRATCQGCGAAKEESWQRDTLFSQSEAPALYRPCREPEPDTAFVVTPAMAGGKDWAGHGYVKPGRYNWILTKGFDGKVQAVVFSASGGLVPIADYESSLEPLGSGARVKKRLGVGEQRSD